MIPFRTRQFLRRMVITLLALVLVAALVLLCWLLWLNRYVVYTRDGVKLDFSLGPIQPGGQMATPPTKGPAVDIYFNEGENTLRPVNTELTQLAGYYITGEMLAQDFAAVDAQVRKLPVGTPVMLDVKNIRGSFYYSTALGPVSESVNAKDVDRLIAFLRSNDYYLIAKLPSFRDYQYGLNNVNFGIFNPNQLSLWMDEDRIYWLNPASEGTLNYLRQIASELRVLGFDEVLFDDFRFPDTTNIYCPYDREETIAATAASLVKICATDTFAVSFGTKDAAFPLPEGRSRLYFIGAAAADAANLAQQTGLEDAPIRVVFLTDLLDTRFDSYGVLRPITSAE
jgi:hypothetical protein